MREYTPVNELLKDVPNYENLYAATKDGRIYSYRRKKFMKISNGNNGYQQVYLTDKFGKKKNAYLHRLIALTYLANPDNLPDINHIDENKSNNDISNLEWTTHQYNLQHSAYQRNKKVYCLELDKTFDSIKEASAYTGIERGGITNCCRGKLKTAGKYHWRYI